MKVPPGGVLFCSETGRPGEGPMIALSQSLLLMLLTICLLCRCAPKTTQAALPFETPDTFSYSGSALVDERWWTAFGDTALNRLIDSALISNFNIRSAWQRLYAANAVVKRESASLIPWVETFAQGGISKAQLDFQESQRFQVGIEASYEVDLWGRLNAISDAAQFRSQSSLADYHTAVMSVAGEITRAWFQRLEAQSQLDLIDAQIETNEQILSLIRNRFGTGLVRSVDILRQRQLIESAREQRTYIEADLQLTGNALAILAGRLPQDSIVLLPADLPELPALPETGVPLELIQRRPDVQSVYYTLRAADRDLAAAISSQYPRLSLSASASSVADNVGNLFKDWTLSLAGNLLAPVFYAGRLRAEVDRNEAVKAELLNSYGQIVLTAFREVEDALALERNQAQSIASIEAQLDLARQSYEQLRLEFFNGISNYLDVLVALTEQQRLERALVSARLSLLEYRIALHRALAGSIETDFEKEMQ